VETLRSGGEGFFIMAVGHHDSVMLVIPWSTALLPPAMATAAAGVESTAGEDVVEVEVCRRSTLVRCREEVVVGTDAADDKEKVLLVGPSTSSTDLFRVGGGGSESLIDEEDDERLVGLPSSLRSMLNELAIF
jgi:hypothetical protein